MYAFCVGVGPIAGWAARASTYYLFKQVEELSVRDPISQQLLRQCGITHARVTADPAFSYEWTCRQERQEDIGIIFRAWSHAPDITSVLQSLLTVARRLRTQGRRVSFISFQKRYRTDLVQWLKEEGQEVLVWDPVEQVLDDFVAELGKFRAFITMRAHGLIVAAQLNVPCVAINLEPKLEIIARECGLEQFVVDLWASPDEIIDRVLEAVNTQVNLNDLLAGKRSQVERERQRLMAWLRASS